MSVGQAFTELCALHTAREGVAVNMRAKMSDADVDAGLFVDALQYWLNAEQHMLVVVDPSDEERRPSQVQFKSSVSGQRWVGMQVWGAGGLRGGRMWLPRKKPCDAQIQLDFQGYCATELAGDFSTVPLTILNLLITFLVGRVEHDDIGMLLGTGTRVAPLSGGAPRHATP